MEQPWLLPRSGGMGKPEKARYGSTGWRLCKEGVPTGTAQKLRRRSASWKHDIPDALSERRDLSCPRDVIVSVQTPEFDRRPRWYVEGGSEKRVESAHERNVS